MLTEADKKLVESLGARERIKMNTFCDTDYEGYKLNGHACSINQFHITPFVTFEYVREDWCTYNAIVIGWLFWRYTYEF